MLSPPASCHCELRSSREALLPPDVISILHVPESRSAAAATVDWLGAAVVTAGLAALVYGFLESRTLGWRNPRDEAIKFVPPGDNYYLGPMRRECATPGESVHCTLVLVLL